MASDSAILTYHSLDDSGSVISVSPHTFAQQMRSLATSGVPVAPLSDVLLRRGSVAITFDDAFQNFSEVALPLLAKYNFPATVFVVTGFCGGFNDWEQYGHAVPRLPLMDWDRIRSAVAAGISFGSHTHTHEKLELANADEQMKRSQDELQQRLGQASPLFAYPFGHVGRGVRDRAAALFSYACGTELGYVNGGSDKICLPRIDAYYLSQDVPALMTARGRGYVSFRRQLRSARKWLSGKAL